MPFSADRPVVALFLPTGILGVHAGTDDWTSSHIDIRKYHYFISTHPTGIRFSDGAVYEAFKIVSGDSHATAAITQSPPNLPLFKY